ncbi:MAG TPA: murein biosynthesis integral membrane protein MurJ [Pseudonocardia sp.]|jgi:putative peptidoglycan lipid II flippase
MSGPSEAPAEQQTDRAASNTARSSLLRAGRVMALASMISRLTGFVRQLAIASALGLAVVNDSYTVANTLPNIVYELLLGGVLSSVMVPVLVRAQQEDPDGGDAFTQKLLTVATTVLVLATGVAIVTAPLLTALYLGGDEHSKANPALATALAVLLLPEIIFYGLGALFGAILNTKGVFGPFAWAPVLNNLVVIAVLGSYSWLKLTVDQQHVRFNDPALLLLGLGTTAGIVLQALILLPSMRRAGIAFRPKWGWDARLRDAGGLALWVVGYVLIGQAGYIVTTRVASHDPGSIATYSNAWLLLQVPYGVLGVSLLTALLPRMSRAAAQGRHTELIKDFSLGSRYTTIALLPITVMIMLFGTSIGLALFSIGKTTGAEATRLGATLAVSAFGLLPYALTMLQLRVFNAMKDARTPTLIQVVMVLVKIPLCYLCPMLLPPNEVVLGLAVSNSMSFVVGAVVGQVWLRHRLGWLGTGQVMVTFGKTAVASSIGGLAGLGAVYALHNLLDAEFAPAGQAWAVLVTGTSAAVVVTLGAAWMVRLEELKPLWRRLAPRR